jgi:hypothetical protein
MNGWDFGVDPEADTFCQKIASGIADQCGMPEADPLRIVNRLWHGQDFETDDLRYHRTVEEWVRHFCFRAGVWPVSDASERGTVG